MQRILEIIDKMNIFVVDKIIFKILEGEIFMSNEEKILSILAELQNKIDSVQIDMNSIKADLATMRANVKVPRVYDKEEILESIEGLSNMLTDEEKISFGKHMDEEETRKEKQREFIRGLATLLDDDEKEELGRYQAAEETRKAALYG